MDIPKRRIADNSMRRVYLSAQVDASHHFNVVRILKSNVFPNLCDGIASDNIVGLLHSFTRRIATNDQVTSDHIPPFIADVYLSFAKPVN